MLFDIHSALQVRNYYKDILIGTQFTPRTEALVSGIFICHEGNVQKGIDILLATNFNETEHFLAHHDDIKDRYEIYVYHYDGANIIYHELDKNLTEKGIQKIYPTK